MNVLIEDKKWSLYEEAIRNDVCAYCCEMGEDGQCHRDSSQECGVRKYLPKLIDIAHRLENDMNMDDYLRAVRFEICNHCDNQREDGTCDVRDSVNCALDRYLSLAFDAVATVRAGKQ